MICLDIYRKNAEIIYKTTLFSKTTLFVVIVGFLSVIFPYLIAYRSRGFWMKYDSFYEQPNVRFMGQYFFTAFTNEKNDNLILCSNLKNINTIRDPCDNIQVREIDEDFNNKIDAIDFQLDFYLERHENLKFFTLVIPVDYKVHNVCPFQMQSAIILQQSNNVKNINEMKYSGDLRIVQRNHLHCNWKGVNSLYNYSVINALDANVEDFEMQHIVHNYANRSISTHLKDLYTSYSRNFNNFYSLHLKIEIPEDKYHYKPELWQILKWAWIQYFSIYIIIAWVFKKIKDYMFENNLLLHYQVRPNGTSK